MTVKVVIGDRVFQVRQSLANELIKILNEGKRFWEWEKEIATLKEIKERVKIQSDNYAKLKEIIVEMIKEGL